jgi:aspartate racemase
LVSIVDSTLESVTADVRTIGVLETPACRKAELYNNALNAAGRACIRLEASDCDVLMEVAYAVKRGDYGSVQKAAARQLAESLVARGAGAIIVACTELPLVLNDKDVSVPLVVTTDALARKTIALARGDLPLPATGK